MDRVGIIAGKFIYGLAIIVMLNSCSVVKTPYFKTDYYKKTVSRLDSLKSEIRIVNDSVYAGFSRISITPSLNNIIENADEGKFKKVPIAGYGQLKEKIATGIHDSIFVKAVALEAGNQKIIIISADILLMPPNIIDSVSESLAKEGIQRNQLFFSATHSHSSIGGWGYRFLGKLFAGKENTEIEKWLINRIKTAILNSLSDLHPARVGSGSFNASEYTRNRLTGNPLEKNDDFNFMVIEQTGLRKAIIGSFSAHSTTIGRKNTLLSADYPGYWERKTEKESADMAIFCGGSMASQSPVTQGDDFEGAKFIGEALADSLSAHLKNVKLSYQQSISSLSLKIFLPEYHIRMTKNKNLGSRLSNRLMPLPKNVYLQVLNINNLIWIFTPADFSGESALLLKNLLSAKGYDAMVTGYNGSYIGYLIPGKYFYLAHYESQAMGWFGPTMGDYALDLIEQMCNAILLNRNR